MFSLAKDTQSEQFKIYGSKKGSYGEVVADEDTFEYGLRIEMNIVNRSVHPVSIYETCVRIGKEDCLLLDQAPTYHSRDHYMFKENILTLPLTIAPFDSARRVLLFNLKGNTPNDVKVIFETSRRKYSKTVIVHNPE
jgi:hypothetical protein